HEVDAAVDGTKLLVRSTPRSCNAVGDLLQLFCTLGFQVEELRRSLDYSFVECFGYAGMSGRNRDTLDLGNLSVGEVLTPEFRGLDNLVGHVGLKILVRGGLAIFGWLKFFRHQ